MPVLVGVPAMVPVVEFSVSPGGSDPETIENVNGALAPLTAMVAEYAVPR